MVGMSSACGADVWFVNRGSSDIVIELWQIETYKMDAPAPPEDLFEESSLVDAATRTYSSRVKKVRVPAGTNDKGVFRVGCGARVWFKWRTVER